MKRTLRNINQLTESIEYRTQLIGRNQRLTSGVNDSRLLGVLLGFIITFILLGVPLLFYKGGF